MRARPCRNAPPKSRVVRFSRFICFFFRFSRNNIPIKNPRGEKTTRHSEINKNRIRKGRDIYSFVFCFSSHFFFNHRSVAAISWSEGKHPACVNGAGGYPRRCQACGRLGQGLFSRPAFGLTSLPFPLSPPSPFYRLPLLWMVNQYQLHPRSLFAQQFSNRVSGSNCRSGAFERTR